LEVGGSWFEASEGKVSTRPYLKNKQKANGIGSMEQVVESLPSKCETPSLIVNSEKKYFGNDPIDICLVKQKPKLLSYYFLF
jgi:hypothetical protein